MEKKNKHKNKNKLKNRTKMKKGLIIAGAVISAIIIIILIIQGVKNKAIRMEEQIENASGNIRVEEKRRFDLIPNLIECVKAYDEHEYNTLVNLVKERGSNSKSADDIKLMINAVAEAYPDLKSQKNYQDLMNELSITENKISEIRKFYNKEVTNYKRFTKQFPNKQLLSLTSYEIKNYQRLEFENSSVDAPKVQF